MKVFSRKQRFALLLLICKSDTTCYSLESFTKFKENSSSGTDVDNGNILKDTGFHNNVRRKLIRQNTNTKKSANRDLRFDINYKFQRATSTLSPTTSPTVIKTTPTALSPSFPSSSDSMMNDAVNQYFRNNHNNMNTIQAPSHPPAYWDHPDSIYTGNSATGNSNDQPNPQPLPTEQPPPPSPTNDNTPNNNNPTTNGDPTPNNPNNNGPTTNGGPAEMPSPVPPKPNTTNGNEPTVGNEATTDDVIGGEGTDVPSLPPSVTASPSVTLMPSLAPSVTASPSVTMMPTSNSTDGSNDNATITGSPTTISNDTVTSSPSIAPTMPGTTGKPPMSIQPSLKPSMSNIPSMSPSLSGVPSASSQPSMSPSKTPSTPAPTKAATPTSSPSPTRTAMPSTSMAPTRPQCNIENNTFGTTTGDNVRSTIVQYYYEMETNSTVDRTLEAQVIVDEIEGYVNTLLLPEYFPDECPPVTNLPSPSSSMRSRRLDDSTNIVGLSSFPRDLVLPTRGRETCKQQKSDPSNFCYTVLGGKTVYYEGNKTSDLNRNVTESALKGLEEAQNRGDFDDIPGLFSILFIDAPPKTTRGIDDDENHDYTWLWAVLGAGGGVFCCVMVGFVYWLHRNENNDDESYEVDDDDSGAGSYKGEEASRDEEFPTNGNNYEEVQDDFDGIGQSRGRSNDNEFDIDSFEHDDDSHNSFNM